MLEFRNVKKDGFSGWTYKRSRGIAGRQVDFAPVCDIGGAGRGNQRNSELFDGGGLQEHASVPSAAGDRDRYDAATREDCRQGTRWLAGVAKGLGRGKFRHDDADAIGRASWSTVRHDDYGRRVAKEASNAAGNRAAAKDGRGDKKRGGRQSSAGNSRRKAEGYRIRAADSERAGEVGGAARGNVRGRDDECAGIGSHPGSHRIGAARNGRVD